MTMGPASGMLRRFGTVPCRAAALSVVAVITLAVLLPFSFAGPALAGTVPAAGASVGLSSTPAPDTTLARLAAAAAQVATSGGYRTGVAVLDLASGTYAGGGEDTASFASESVVKVLIATELLLTGQMTGPVADEAYQMITESDDADADALYGLAGGDAVVDDVAAHYGIPFLGSPPKSPGYWGNTHLTAKGMVYLYAALARDPVVGPWLMNAMANATPYGADGTYQFFGLPSATSGAAVKQGWGDDGDDAPDAVFDSTGFVGLGQAGGGYAVAILTDGPPDSYGGPISGVLSAQAQALLPGGLIDDATAHDPSLTGVTVSAAGNSVTVQATATDPDTGGPVQVVVREHATVLVSTPTDAAHQASVTMHAADGAHDYTVVAVNVGEGTADATVLLPTVSVNGDPSGSVATVTCGAGTVTITGAETDPNLPAGASPRLSVRIDGGPARTVAVGRTTQAAGPAPVKVVLPAPTGSHRITVTWLGEDGAADILAGTWPVTVRPTAGQVRRADLEHAGMDLGGGATVLGGMLLPWRRRHPHRARVAGSRRS